ncbi:unnamed protein product, partial [Mesorhabditis belari]|uniref:Uncharacterized protein n=1 Tax=Mesorhabditis belari TaxID=2138241 RepID=A0AAF3FT48_9BILA
MGLKRILLLLFVVVIGEAVKLPDGWTIRETNEVISELSKNCPVTSKSLVKLEEKLANPITLLYGSIPRFYMQAVADISKKHPNEMAQLAEEKHNLEETYKSNATEAKLSILKHVVNIVNITLANIEEDEILTVRSHLFETADIVDGNEILDYNFIFSPVYTSKLTSLPRKVLKFFDTFIADYKEKLKTSFGNSPNSLKALSDFEAALDGDFTELKNEKFLYPQNLTYPLIVLKLAHLAPRDEIANSTALFAKMPEEEKDFDELKNDLNELLPKSLPLIEKLRQQFESQAKKLLDEISGTLEKSRASVKGKDETLEKLLTKVNGEYTEKLDELQKKLTWHVKKNVYSDCLELLSKTPESEYNNLHKFVGVLARFAARQQLRKGGYRFWQSFKTTAPNLQALTGAVKEAFSNVTAGVHNAAQELLTAAQKKVSNQDFLAFATKIDTVLEAKMTQLTNMQSMQVHLAYPIPILLIINDLPRPEYEYFEKQREKLAKH